MMFVTPGAASRSIQFKFAAHKGLTAIHWMVSQVPDVDLHTVLKTCYLADKQQLNEWTRPVFGATYRAMRFGPVPLEIYEMAKGESIWLAELELDDYPWELRGYRLHLTANHEPDLSYLSDADFSALKQAFSVCRGVSFNARTAMTHGPDWQAANLALMSYEDMLEDSPDKPEKIEYLRESAPYMAL